MQHWKFGAFGLAIGAMLVFLPLAGKLGEAKDQKIRMEILMSITCVMPKEVLTEKLNQVEIPEDNEVIKEGQNKTLWEKAKSNLLAECYD